MIRPESFAANPQTAATNTFQRGPALDRIELAEIAAAEFDGLVSLLIKHHIETHVHEGSIEERLPDEVFPNNWLSTHADGRIAVYPMLAPNRRQERRADIIDWLRNESGFAVESVVDLSQLELTDEYLEGTGSLVLDRSHGIAYAALSPRTTQRAVDAFADVFDYETVVFSAVDEHGSAIFHTNMLLSIGTAFAVLCADTIRNPAERRRVFDKLAATGREILELDAEQLRACAGNILELSSAGDPVIAMSTRARAAYTPKQLRMLERNAQLLVADVSTIEEFGGGSVRCMLAEIHLPRIE